MNLLFLLPSVGYGLFLFLSTGSPLLLMLSALTLLVWLLVASQKALDPKQPVTVIDGRIWLGDRRLNLFPWSWSAAVRNVVYPQLFREERTKVDIAQGPSWAIGQTGEGEWLASPLCTQTPHGIVIGQTGAGKTELVKRLIEAFPGEVFVIDFKLGEDFRDCGERVKLLLASEVATAIELIRSRLAEPRGQCLFVIDELGEAVRNPAMCQQLEALATRGRALQAHFLGAAQTMTGIPRNIWTNCHSRFALRADAVDRAQLGFPVKPLDQEVLGYCELLTKTVIGFHFAPSLSKQLPTEDENPLLFRVATKPWSAPFEESAPSRQTPWDR